MAHRYQYACERRQTRIQCSHRFHRLGISPRTSAPPVAYKQLLSRFRGIVCAAESLLCYCASRISYCDGCGWVGDLVVGVPICIIRCAALLLWSAGSAIVWCNVFTRIWPGCDLNAISQSEKTTWLGEMWLGGCPGCGRGGLGSSCQSKHAGEINLSHLTAGAAVLGT